MHLEILEEFSSSGGEARPQHSRSTADNIDNAILAALAKRSPLSRIALREQLHIRNQRLGEALQRLADTNLVTRLDDGAWQLR